ncbi:MAG: type 1 fimbrial protein [Pseudomonas sp.]|nr:type 1 fimbrial protein [Pseudomonas sp.]
MNSVFASAACGLLLGLSCSSFAATPVAHGVISFTGRIMEDNCTSSAGSSGLNMSQCPQASRGGAIEVQRIDPQTRALDHSIVKVKLLADSGRQGRYYDQQYAFVDQSGKAVTSGAYLITLSVP